MRGDRRITCRRCHSAVSAGSRFCGACGAAMPLGTRQPIPTHRAPVTLIVVTTLPLLMVVAIGFVLASVAPTGASQTGNAAATLGGAGSSGTTKETPAAGGGTSSKEPEESSSTERKEPQPEKASVPAPGYNLIETPDGSLSAEVPLSWGVETAENSEKEGTGEGTWSFHAGVYLPSSITTAPNIDTWYSGEQSSGAYFVASKTLAQNHTDYEITHSLLNANKEQVCAAGPYETYDRPPYLGKIQAWYECGDDDATVYTLAAFPKSRDCVVALNARISDEADTKAIEHLINTFKVDCKRVES